MTSRYYDLAILPDLDMFKLGEARPWAEAVTGYLKGLQNQKLALFDRTGNSMILPDGSVSIDTPHLAEDSTATLSLTYDASALNLTINTVWQDLAEVELFSLGVPVMILCGWQLGSNTYNYARLIRDGDTANPLWSVTDTSDALRGPRTAISADVPAPGYHTYTLQGYGNAGFGLTPQYGLRFISILEILR